LHVLLAAAAAQPFLAPGWIRPLVDLTAQIIGAIDHVVGNPGWSLIIFALLLKLVFWPLNFKQFMAMIKMQQLAPQLKRLQDKYGKSDPQRYQKETMELYRTNGANPLAGCWPILVQYPFIISVYYAVVTDPYRPIYENQHWLWIGTAITQHLPTLPVWNAPLLASSLALPDLILLVVYMISMYLIARYGTMPSTDPQQAQTQKFMAILSPLMLAYVGFRWKWPSAMVLYWLSYNLFSMGQQLYLLRKYHQPLSVLDNEHAITDIPAEQPKVAKAIAPNGAAKRQTGSPKTPAKKKKGAKR
jgi:YidC/Oxa1 family membrane protein insertase